MYTQTTQAQMSRHATSRAQQRGVQLSAQQAVFAYGDIEEPAGDGLYKLAVSSKELRSLTAQRTLTPAEASRCKGLILVTDGKLIVTVYRKH